MQWNLLSEIIISSVCLYSGLFFTVSIDNKKKDISTFSYIVTCLILSSYFILSGDVPGTGTDFSSITPVIQQGIIFLCILSISLFVFSYANNHAGKFSRICFIILTTATAAGLILATTETGIIVARFFIVLITLYLSYTISGLIRNPEDSPGHMLFPVMPFITAASFNDLFIVTGLYSMPELLPHACFIFIIYSGILLQKDRIRTIKELEELNISLETKINNQTMELFFSEIGRKLYKDILREIPQKDKDLYMYKRREEKEERYQHKLKKMRNDISIIINLEEILDKSLKKSMEILDADSGCIMIADTDGTLSVKACENIDRDTIEPYIDRAAKKVFFEKDNLITDRNKISASDSDADSDETIICSPIFLRNDVIGIYFLEKTQQPGRFNDTDASILRSFIRQSVNAIESAFIYQRMINQKRKHDSATVKNLNISAATEERLKKAVIFIEDNYHEEISRDALAATLNMHPDTLGRYFKMYTGKKISEYVNYLRIKEASQLLKKTDNNIIDIAFTVGFESLTTFNRIFMKKMNITPSAYRKMNKLQ